jgi:hypothetical protein
MKTDHTYRNVRWLFVSNALINWTICLPGLLNPAFAAEIYGGTQPNYPSIVRLWMGFVFMFGCMFWEISRDVRRKAALIKYNWIEKTITATAILGGYFLGDIPPRLTVMIILTNLLWIPFLIWSDLAVKRAITADVRLSQPSLQAS